MLLRETFSVVLLSSLLLGCAASRTARVITAENIAANHSAVIGRSLDSPVIPSVTVSGSSNTVTISPQRALSTLSVNDDSRVNGEASGDYASATKLSFSSWLAVGFAAGCLALLLFAWVLFAKLSAAGQAADRGFSVAIDTVGALASHATTPDTIAALATVKGDLEKRRGQVAGR